MKNIVGAFLIAVISGPVLITEAAPVREEWVARYNGSGNRVDGSEAIALDPEGNVYVTGVTWVGSDTGYDYATIKYDAAGTEIWVSRYDGPSHGSDDAHAIAVDASGNVYVTGESWGYSSDTDPNDYATVKYDANGNELWVARYNGTANGYDTAKAVAVDAAGNVYVTGWSDGAGTGFDYATVKYDLNGNGLWVARYNGATNGFDFANAMAVDADGNVYVTGQSNRVGAYSDYATVKYDANGNELWVARYNGPGNRSNAATALAVDSAGNVYVTGWSEGSATSYDYATVKYDANGNELWAARYDGPTNGFDFARALVLDPAGNVYVAGFSSRTSASGFYDYATIKYSADGKEVWVAKYSGLLGLNRSNTATGIALDAAGNVYVTGWGGGAVSRSFDQDYATVKYDNNGNELWLTRYNYAYAAEDLAKAIAVDAAGNVYVTGQSVGLGTDFDFATIKYSQQ